MTKALVWHGVVCGLLCALVAGTGCKGGNIFGFRGPSDENISDLIARGQDRLRDGKFDEAVTLFDKAMKADPQNSDARFYHAKGTLLASGVSIVKLLREVSDNLKKTGTQLPLYSPDPNLSQEEDETQKTKLYQAMNTIVEDLTPISQGLTHGSFDSSSIGLDLAVANAAFGILRLRDTNTDLEIKVPPDFFFDFNIIPGGPTVDYQIEDLGDAIAPEGASPEQIMANAEQLNVLIEEFSGRSAEDPSIVERIIENIINAGLLEGDTTIGVEDLREAMEILGRRGRTYFINTGVPGNPGEGDNDGDGRIDEEFLNGIDDDHDNWTDEDARLN
jgi:hypothetical protein